MLTLALSYQHISDALDKCVEDYNFRVNIDTISHLLKIWIGTY